MHYKGERNRKGKVRSVEILLEPPKPTSETEVYHCCILLQDIYYIHVVAFYPGTFSVVAARLQRLQLHSWANEPGEHINEIIQNPLFVFLSSAKMHACLLSLACSLGINSSSETGERSISFFLFRIITLFFHHFQNMRLLTMIRMLR